MRRFLFVLGLLVAVAANLHADEIRLKDGSKIVGTIVDFQDGSFKVQTAFGFAMVRKDSIAQIIPDALAPSGTAATTPASAATAREAAPTSSSPVRSQPQPAVARSAASSTPTPPATKPVSPTPLPMPAPSPRRPASAPVTAVATPVSAPAAALPAEPTPLPAPPVAPGLVRESVTGNAYTNETYQFRLYRPPNWELLPETRQGLPNAVTAMGTSDQAALFVIGREPRRDSLEAQASNAQQALQKVYENYRQSSITRRTVSGLPAVEWRFRGWAEGHDWSVTALTVVRGGDAFTALGMTYADSDPILQIRENVIAKIIGSLEFSAPR
jgi:hypothetical protein